MSVKIYSSGTLVSSGGVITSAVLAEGGNNSMYVSNGGTANSTTVNSSGNLRVSSGGIANYATVNDAGDLDVLIGGTASNIIINGGSVSVYNSGSAVSAQVHSGKLCIFSGGYATYTTVDKSGILTFGNPGTANYTTVNSGGSMYIKSGGIANSTTVNSNGSMYVSSGGTANSTTVNSSGRMYVRNGGIANDTMINSFGNQVISSGGITNSTTVTSSGYVWVLGGIANSTIVSFYGSMFVDDGIANDTIVNSSGKLYVRSNGVASDTTVNSSGLMRVLSGGIANNTTVNSWGSMYVSSGGTATNIIASTGAYLGFVVAPDTYIQGTSNGSAFEIKDGKVDNYIINRGYLHISNGGTANNNIVNNTSGELRISSGGVASNTTVHNGNLYIDNGGVASDTIMNYGSMYVSKGGTANSITYSDGSLYIYGSANNIITNSGMGTGEIIISDGGVVDYFTVNGRGNSYNSFRVESGGVANSVIINGDYAGRLDVGGGIVNDVAINGGTLYVSKGIANDVVFNRGLLATAEDVVINNLSINGSLQNTSLNDISIQGIVNNLVVNGPAYNVKIHTVNSGIINSGAVLRYSGDIINDMIVNSGGALYYTNYTIVNNLTIKQGGRINGFSFNSDVIIESGVHISNAVVSYGDAYLYSGQIATNTMVNSGGRMYVSSGGIVGGTLRTETGAVVSAYEGSIIDFTVADRTAEDDYLINDLSLIQGSPTYTITVHSSQTTGTYKLAQGAENFTGTLSIGTETTNYGTITVNGDILVRNDLSYKLVQDNGDLTLGIYRFADISRVTANTVYPTQKLYLFATFNEHSAQKFYSYDQKTWIEYDKNVLVEDNVTVYFKALNGNGVESEIKSYTVTNIDKTPPTLTISGNPTEWTNQGITLDVRAEDANGIARIEYSEDSGATWKTWSSRYLESGNFLFRAIDTVGNISSVSEVIVDKIDTIQPTLKGLKGLPSTWTNQDTFVTIVAEDNLSGIAKIEYAFNYSNEFTEGSSFVLSRPYGSVTVRVTDNAGNVTERIYYDVGLRYVEKIAPQITINHNPDLETWRNGAVSLTIFVTDDGGSSIKEEKYRFDYEPEDTWHRIGSQVVVTQNCTVYFQLEDKAGNITNEEITINCIDNTIPVFTVTQSPHELTNESVTITINAEDDLSGIKSVEYSFNQSEWFECNSFTMDRNGVYWVRVSDNAGNISVVRRYEITNIDKIAPKINKITETAIGNGILFNGDFEDNVGIAKVQYRVNSGEYLDYNSNGIFLSYNANIKFKITDLAGNVCEEVYKIANCRESNTFASWDGNDYGDSYRLKIYSQNSVANKGFEIIGTKFECLTSFKNVEYVVYNQDNKQIRKGSVSGDDVINGSYLRASADGIKEVFLARTNGVWGSLMRAEYQGSADVEEKVILKGKNKICDIFVGSDDSNILFLTNDQNGDALFIDDIYSASFDNLGESNSRLAQIKEIQAGDGDDIIDLTSAKFDYSGSEMTIYGGSGNDIIWANDSVDNVIHGGLGDDTLVGGSQANTFVFEANWGNDVIYYNGTVTLNFIGVTEVDLTLPDTIRYNGNTITLINFENQDYTITYSQLA